MQSLGYLHRASGCGVRIDSYAEIGVRKYTAAMPLTSVVIKQRADRRRGYSSIMISDAA